MYGDNSLGFKSWREAIFTISKGLKEDYVDKGYTEPFAMNRKYAASKTWGRNVTFFMNDLDKYTQNYQFDIELAEIEHQNYQAHLDRERLLSAITAMNLQTSLSSTQAILQQESTTVNSAINSAVASSQPPKQKK